MYEARYGIQDGRERSWVEVATDYRFDPAEAVSIGKEIDEWLEANSPYRNGRSPEQFAHRNLA